MTVPFYEAKAGLRQEVRERLDHGVLHDYGKSPRPGRKLGHITVTAETASERDRLVDQINETVTLST